MKAMCPPGYHHNGHMATHALEHMMYGSGYIYIYICMYIYPCMLYVYIYTYVFMKAMCPPGYHRIGHMATHALGHMIYGCTSCAQVHELP